MNKEKIAMLTLKDNAVKHFEEMLVNKEGGIRIFSTSGG